MALREPPAPRAARTDRLCRRCRQQWRRRLERHERHEWSCRHERGKWLAGTNGTAGLNGIDGADGADGLDGSNGTIAPLSATDPQTDLPTATPPTTVVELTVPAGNYVVLAKTQLSHTGAGDSIDCLLKAGGVTLDRIGMKTLPALAAMPASLQAVATLLAPTT